MESVKVKIKGSVISARFGVLQSGAIVQTDREYARHLVVDCGAGEYLDAKPEKDATETKPEAQALEAITEMPEKEATEHKAAAKSRSTKHKTTGGSNG